jgi:hypothetical protein
MKSAAKEITKEARFMHEAEQAGIAGPMRSLARESERGVSKGNGFDMER